MQPYYAPNFQVKVAGLSIEADVSRAVIDLSYDNSIETADMFRMQIDNSGLRFTDSPLFDVGKSVEIAMGYGGDLRPMMLGEITAVSPSFPASGAPTLAITGYDRSQRLRHNSPDRYTFKNMNDSLIAAQIATENDLIPIVDPAPTSPQPSLQQVGSDWALLEKLAARNFFQVYVRWNKLYFQLPRPQTKLVALEWGKNLSSFSPRLSTAGMVGIQVIRGYDTELAQAIVASIPVVSLDTDLDNIVERLGSDFVQRLAKLGRRVVRGHHPTSFMDATVLAQSLLKQLLEGLYEGSGSCIGMPELRAGEQIEILGLGKRFSGRYRLYKVTHTINSGGYQTSFEISQRQNLGLLGSLRSKLEDGMEQGGRQRYSGITIGKVMPTKDSKQPGKVQVNLPELSDGNLSAWATVATPMAGADGSGMYFLPKPDEQVMVGFEGGDIDRPYILGSLWSATNRPEEAQQGAEHSMIRTRSGMRIMFDETKDKETLTIAHPNGSTIIMEHDGTVRVEVKETKNIELKTQGDIKLTAAGDIELNAANVKVKVSEEGTMNVS
jgi:phage protein D/phage baseplate assembly protein gpV